MSGVQQSGQPFVSARVVVGGIKPRGRRGEG
jgi:hypothetical protein